MSLIQIAFIAYFVSVAAGLWGYFLWNGMAAKTGKGLFAIAAAASLILICVSAIVHGVAHVSPPAALGTILP